MAIPGSNLLKQAAKVIKLTSIEYYQFKGRKANAMKDYLDTYSEPFSLKASVQAVNRSRYVQLGLDYQKDYVKIWSSHDLIALARSYSGDVFIWNGKTYKLIDDTNWDAQDGWASSLAVKINNFSGVTS